jgi:hypothetical protein
MRLLDLDFLTGNVDAICIQRGITVLAFLRYTVLLRDDL